MLGWVWGRRAAMAREHIAFEISEQGWESQQKGLRCFSLSLGNCKQEEMNLIYFPLSTTGKGANLRAEYTNKTKDLTLGGKMLIPRREMWYSHLAHYPHSETHSQLLHILRFHDSNLNYMTALTPAMLLLLLFWCCPSKWCSAITRVMKPWEAGTYRGSSKHRGTDTQQATDWSPKPGGPRAYNPKMNFLQDETVSRNGQIGIFSFFTPLSHWLQVESRIISCL